MPLVPNVPRDKSDQAPQEHRFPCEQCGADLRFAPGVTELVCPQCGHQQSIRADTSIEDATREQDFNQMLAKLESAAPMEETRVTSCPNCGAQIEFQPDIHATECPFCAAPVVADTGTHRHIKPAALVPFGFDENTARKAMTDWLGRLWFAPNGLQDYARKGRPLNGIYVPYWTYDADTKSSYTGQKGVHYYETQRITVNGKSETRQVQKTRWYPASGRVARFFDDVLVLGSTSLPKQYTDGLAPWNLTDLHAYAPQYLAGFRAEGYQVQLDQGFVEARQIMDNVILSDVRQDIGGDVQRVNNVDTDVNDVTFKHILLPVWLAAYKYRDRTFRFVVNGQTGKVQGERPYSAWKITFAVIVGAIVAGAIGYAVYLNQ